MKFRTATIFIAVAILTLFTTACGGGGGGGGGDVDEDDFYSVYTDDSGYDHAFGGMTEGYYYYIKPDGYTDTRIWVYLSSDGSWKDWEESTTDMNYSGFLRRYTVEEDGLHLLEKFKADAYWFEYYTVTSSDDTSFTVSNYSGMTFTYSGTTPLHIYN